MTGRTSPWSSSNTDHYQLYRMVNNGGIHQFVNLKLGWVGLNPSSSCLYMHYLNNLSLLQYLITWGLQETNLASRLIPAAAKEADLIVLS